MAIAACTEPSKTLPEAAMSDTAPSASSAPSPPTAQPVPPTSSAAAEPSTPCPKDMVLVPAQKPYCIDRWEAVVVDKKSGRRFSPYYSPLPKSARSIRDIWQKKRLEVGDATARAMPLPPLPEWQLSDDTIPMAVSLPGQTPQGYLSGKVARMVCENAGKRLCSPSEWVHACRGVANRPFPYGDTYQQGACNIFRFTHPAGALHDDVTTGHLDPRLNQVKDKQGLLLRPTGETKTCASQWGNDAVYDMVGNLDEWVEDEKGMFLGGFFSRSKKDGCASVVKNHPNEYWDYSLGVRCCRAMQEQ